MAIEKILNTRLKLRYDSHENWMTNDPVLYAGEVALSTVSVKQDGDVNFVPSVLIKVGDGTHKYSELDFAFAKAADVVSAAKSEASLKTFINSVIADAGIASSDAMEALAGRVTATETAITTLNGDAETAGSVAKAIKDAIDALNLADTYAAKEHVHSWNDLEDKPFGEEAALFDIAWDGDMTGHETLAVQGGAWVKVSDEVYTKEQLVGATVYSSIGEEVIGTDDLNEDIPGAIAVINNYGGAYLMIVYSATDFINAAGVEGSASNGVWFTWVPETNEGTTRLAAPSTIKTLDDKYLSSNIARTADVDAKLADYYTKTESDAKYALKGEDSYDDTELTGRVKAIEDDYLKAADKTALQDQITANANAITVLTDGIDPEKIDGLTDLVNWANEHAPEVESIKNDIEANTQAISDEASRATGVEESLAGRLDAVEADMESHVHSWNDLEDKPFGEEGVTPITFNGNLEEYEAYTAEMEGAHVALIRVSDKVFTKDQLLGAVIETVGFECDSWTVYDLYEEVSKPGYFTVRAKDGNDLLDSVFMVNEAGLETMEAEGVILPGVGIYFQRIEADGMIMEVRSITFSGGSIKTLDDKYISDNIARTESVTALSGRVDALEAIDHEAYKGYADGLNAALDARLDVLEAIDHEAYVGADTALKTELSEAIEAAKADASNQSVVVLSEAQKYSDGINTALDARLQTLEAIDHDAYQEADTALKNELQGKIDAIDNHSHANKTLLDSITDEKVTAWDGAEQNAKNYADDILEQAKAYSDSLNHEDTKYTAAADGGLKLNENNEFSIDDTIVFILDCGNATV